MAKRCHDLGNIAAELQPHSLNSLNSVNSVSSDIHDFESFYNSTVSEVNKFSSSSSSSSSSRYPGDHHQSSQMDPVELRGFSTAVSVEESDFLEEFMACDFSTNRDSRIGSLTDISFSGSLSELDNIPRTSEPHYGSSCHPVPGVSGRDQVSHGHMSTTGYKYPSYHNEQENRFPGTRRILSAYGSNNQQSSVGSKSLKVMKQKGGNSNDTGGSLLRQQLQGSLCSNKYRKTQETLCRECNRPFSAKCLLKTCRKSDEVLCPDCGHELTAKCLLKSCSGFKG